MQFASDNSSGAHPDVMDAMVRANEGFAPSYGADPAMDEVTAQVREIFEAPEAAVYLVATGTAANSISLAAICPPWSAVYCHRHSHIMEDECGAPEFFSGGAKLVPVYGEGAKIDPVCLSETLKAAAHVGVHNVQRGAVSITNVTEMGAVYSPDEITELCAIAKEWNLPCHLDGARLANALVATGASPAEMTWRAGIDVVSLGGTKNGLIGAEAVVIFDAGKSWEFELRRKRGGHLFSKHRYLSAQMRAYLKDRLWLRMARAANSAAARLAQGISTIEGASLLSPPDANMVFAVLPRAAHQRAIKAGAVYYPWPAVWPESGPDDQPLSARMVCSWCTSDTEVDALLTAFRVSKSRFSHTAGTGRRSRMGDGFGAGTTEPGYINRNGQVVIKKTDLPGNGLNQSVYVLECTDCKPPYQYGANGCDIWQRKCPNCQGGEPGLSIDI